MVSKFTSRRMLKWVIPTAISSFIWSCDNISRKKDDSLYIATASHSTHRIVQGEENAKRHLKEALDGKRQAYPLDTLIKTSSTAIAIVEPILFELFGKQQIISERPYEVYLLDGYWYLSGTIPKGSDGGGFEIILSARNAEIIRLTHYK